MSLIILLTRTDKPDSWGAIVVPKDKALSKEFILM